MSAKLLIIALDGADGRLLDVMSRSGAMSNLASLRSKGAFRFLDNRAEMSDDSIWASFQFGAPLADHGRYHFLVPLGSGRAGMAVKYEDGRQTFWHRLSAQGLSVCVIDVPKCPVPVALNGIQLADWSVHGHYFKAPQSYPPDLAGQVVAELGTQECKWCDYHQPLLDDEKVGGIVSDLLASIEAKRRVACEQLSHAAWDMAIIGFKEAHCAGHGLWQFADRQHAEFDAARLSRLGDPVGRVYRALDAAIGDLLAASGSGTEVLVFSNCFMEPNGSIHHLRKQLCDRLDQVLSRRHQLPANHPQRLCALLEANDNQLALRLSRQDPALFASLLRETTVLLTGLLDAGTGRPVFDRIERPSTQRQGKARGRLPDIVAWCKPNVTPQAVVSQHVGRIEAPVQRMRPGNHSMGGAVFATGPKVSALSGRLVNVSDFADVARDFFFAAPDRPTAP
ncbi:MAG: alkaline phosphatase family protein [Aestuariivirga sp.]|nr:alkaline phosphatase family protein [Aestuariivirga sp.]